MNISRLCFVFSLILTALPAAAEAPPRTMASPPTALDRYVAAKDDHFAWKVVNQSPVAGGTFTVIELTSQQWLTEKEVDKPVWKHWLKVITPDKVENPVGLLMIGGGSNDKPAPEKAPSALTLVGHVGAPALVLLHHAGVGVEAGVGRHVAAGHEADAAPHQHVHHAAILDVVFGILAAVVLHLALQGLALQGVGLAIEMMEHSGYFLFAGGALGGDFPLPGLDFGHFGDNALAVGFAAPAGIGPVFLGAALHSVVGGAGGQAEAEAAGGSHQQHVATPVAEGVEVLFHEECGGLR